MMSVATIPLKANLERANEVLSRKEVIEAKIVVSGDEAYLVVLLKGSSI